MAINLDKLVTSEANYEKSIKETLETIRKDKDMESTLKKIVLFCKYAFTVNFVQKKKYLCLNVPLPPSSSSRTSPRTLNHSIFRKFWMRTSH